MVAGWWSDDQIEAPTVSHDRVCNRLPLPPTAIHESRCPEDRVSNYSLYCT